MESLHAKLNWHGQIESSKVKLSQFSVDQSQCSDLTCEILYTCLQIYHLEPSPGGGCLSQYSSNCKMQCKVHQSGLHITHTHFTDQVKQLCAFIYLFLILFLISHLFNRQTDINECLPMYVHGLVAFFFFDFPKKWTADSEKQDNKLVWPKQILEVYFIFDMFRTRGLIHSD